MPLTTIVLNKAEPVLIIPDACPFALGSITGEEDIFREISGIRVNNTLEARITCTTTVDADVKVVWGTSKGSMVNDTGFVSTDSKFHEIFFTGLAESTEYVFQVTAQSDVCDEAGETIVSDYYWFRVCS